MGVGIDICYIPRYENKDDLAKRILSNDEYKIYEVRQKKAEFLAGRFATKEAFIKATVIIHYSLFIIHYTLL